MTPMFKGTLWILLIIALFAAMSKKSHAGTIGELREQLSEKVVIYDGTCHLNRQLMFEPVETPDHLVRRCTVYANPREFGVSYALIFESVDRPIRLIRVDKTTEKVEQSVVWTSARMT